MLQQLARVGLQAPEPGQLVVEFRPGLRIAVGQIDAADQDAADGGLDVARLIILRIAGQGGPRHDRLRSPRQDGDAVPGPLPAPHGVISGPPDRIGRKLRVGAFEFLQADDVGLRALEPVQQVGQAAVDVVDVEGRDLHPGRVKPGALARRDPSPTRTPSGHRRMGDRARSAAMNASSDGPLAVRSSCRA